MCVCVCWCVSAPGCKSPCHTHTAHLRAVFDVVSFVEAKVAQVIGRRPFAGLSRLRGQGEVREVIRQAAEAVHDIVEGPVR